MEGYGEPSERFHGIKRPSKKVLMKYSNERTEAGSRDPLEEKGAVFSKTRKTWYGKSRLLMLTNYRCLYLCLT